MELMFWSFATVAYDQIVNNAAQVRYMSGGLINCPIVIRGPANGGTNVGATHSHCPENWFAAIPGLKVVNAATPYDAKGLMKTAIRDNDPVLFMESTILYGEKGEVPEEEYLIPLGKADIKKEGTDITLIAHGRAVLTALKAAELLAAEHDVPMVENKPVARLLFKVGKVGKPIPIELYQAVADILAFVYKTHRYYFHRLKERRAGE
jgi:pyruvate dehydrogenase E1 component beta subunit